MIKAVIFDVDGVLLDSRKANILWFKRLLKATGYEIPSAKKLEKAHTLTLLDCIRELTGERSERRIKEIFKNADNYAKYPIELVTVPKGVVRVLKQLRKQYKLAIVTSRIGSTMKEFFDLAKVDNLFEVIVAFGDYKKAKPSPEPLLIAARRLGLKPGECIYIGDSDVDVAAANAAGMKIIFYSGSNTEGADIVLHSFGRIPQAVKRLS